MVAVLHLRWALTTKSGDKWIAVTIREGLFTLTRNVVTNGRGQIRSDWILRHVCMWGAES